MPILYRDLRFAMALEASLEEANAVVGKLDARKFYGADTFNSVKVATQSSLALVLAKIFEVPPKRGKLANRFNGSDKASIPVVLYFLRQKRVRSAMVERAIVEGGSQGTDWCRQALESAERKYRSLKGSRRFRLKLQSITDFRNGTVAHSLHSVEPARLPTYNDLFELLDAAADIVSQIKLATEGTNLFLDDFEKEDRRSAAEFWGKALPAAMRD
jgi:hypothetical protein